MSSGDGRDAMADPGARGAGGAGAAGGEVHPSRREFLRVLGGSTALAGLGACAQPAEHILPYVDRPPEVTPGESRLYATSLVVDGVADGVLVASRDGRPIKVEGNPDHPGTAGGTGAIHQAALLQLYDPHRARRVRRQGEHSSWDTLTGELLQLRARSTASGGAGLALLLEPTSSPLELELLERVRERYPEARVHVHSPLWPEGGSVGAEGAAGAAGAAPTGAAPTGAAPTGAGPTGAGPTRGGPEASDGPRWGRKEVLDLTAAEIVVALDADILGGGTYPVRYARDFARRRRLREPGGTMNRLYVAEAAPSPTGVLADHRLRTRSCDVHRLLAALLALILESGAGPAGAVASPGVRLQAVVDGLDPPARRWVRRTSRDLLAHRGSSVVVVGPRQPRDVRALAHLVNEALGNTGTAVRTIEDPVHRGGAGEDLASLVAAMDVGEVESLLILGGNPAYAAPVDLSFAARLEEVPWSLHLTLHHDETSGGCTWSAPRAHELESWGDARAFDGTVSFVQPLVRPLHGGRTSVEFLAFLAGEDIPDPRMLLRERWTGRLEAGLRRGFLPGTEASTVPAGVGWGDLPEILPTERPLDGRPSGGRVPLELSFEPDPAVLDGRLANNPWLQELPDPVTKLTWGNAVLLAPATARRFGVETGDVVRLRWRGREVEGPVLTVPGHVDDAVTVRLGYGRGAAASEVARGVGFDAYRLRTGDTPWFGTGLELEPVPGARQDLATTQRHDSMEGRPLVLDATLEEYRAHPDFTERYRGPQPSLYEPFQEEYRHGPQWAMAIDLSLCTGCSACMVACQAENNVPVVGKEGVLNGREMHWLRIDRYYRGPPEDPEVLVQPMLCQHCEKAPCEYVCPVNATVHSPDGLNEMVYNRCVGTRFCSNNCPYKVRRFNWHDYNAGRAETEQMAMNPDVTVRGRGVIEKCTFCVQRIRRAGIRARNDGREVRPGEVRTACQQACPTTAISFGSLHDPDPELERRLAAPHRYHVLHDLGTRPRVTYLARIRNAAPEPDG